MGVDLTALGFIAIDGLYAVAGVSPTPFFGFQSPSDNGACAALGIKRTPVTVTLSTKKASAGFLSSAVQTLSNRLQLRIAFPATHPPRPNHQ